MSGFAFIEFYLLFIITLPVKIRSIWLLIICFLYGVLLDVTLAGGGIYTMTTTFIGFIRPRILRLFFAEHDHYRYFLPTSRDMGFIQFVVYCLFILILSTLFYYTIEHLHSFSVFAILKKSLLSSLSSLVVIYIAQAVLLNSKKRRL